MNLPHAFFTSRVTEALASLALHVTSARNIAASLKPIKTAALDLEEEEEPRPIITSITPSRIPYVSYAGASDFTIKGKNLTEASVDEFELFFEDDPSNVYPAVISLFGVDGFRASVNLSGAALGSYEVRIRDENGTPHLPGLTVEIETDESSGGTSNGPGKRLTVKIQSQTQGDDTVVLAADANGTDPLSYQWYKDGKPIARQTKETYTISKAGIYSVVVGYKSGLLASATKELSFK
jgi:hypothetical protein